MVLEKILCLVSGEKVKQERRQQSLTATHSRPGRLPLVIVPMSDGELQSFSFTGRAQAKRERTVVEKQRTELLLADEILAGEIR